MKHYSLIIVLLMCGFCFSCRPVEDEDHHYIISFYNNSEADLYVVDDVNYPDTILRYSGFLHYPEIYKVKAHSLNRDGLKQERITYEQAFSSYKGYKTIKNDTLIVFVLDAEKLEKNGFPVMDALLVRYDLSLQDLQRMNWSIAYPLQENMKSIKMWPKNHSPQ